MPRTTKASNATRSTATVTDVGGTGTAHEQALLAAEAVSTLLPATHELSVGVPQPPALVDTASWAGGAVAVLSGGPGVAGGGQDGMVCVLVGKDLVDALAGSPMGPLELGDALQPSLDAAAAAMDASAGPGRTVTAEELPDLLAAATVAVPLVALGVTSAILLVTEPAVVVAVKPPTKGGGKAASGATRGGAAGGRRGIELLHGIAMDVTVELGRTRLSVRELLALTPGDVIELDRAAGSPADLLVNGRLIARGEVVVIDENFALRITEIVANAAAG